MRHLGAGRRPCTHPPSSSLSTPRSWALDSLDGRISRATARAAVERAYSADGGDADAASPRIAAVGGVSSGGGAADSLAMQANPWGERGAPRGGGAMRRRHALPCSGSRPAATPFMPPTQPSLASPPAPARREPSKGACHQPGGPAELYLGRLPVLHPLCSHLPQRTYPDCRRLLPASGRGVRWAQHHARTSRWGRAGSCCGLLAVGSCRRFERRAAAPRWVQVALGGGPWCAWRAVWRSWRRCAPASWLTARCTACWRHSPGWPGRWACACCLRSLHRTVVRAVCGRGVREGVWGQQRWASVPAGLPLPRSVPATPRGPAPCALPRSALDLCPPELRRAGGGGAGRGARRLPALLRLAPHLLAQLPRQACCAGLRGQAGRAGGWLCVEGNGPRASVAPRHRPRPRAPPAAGTAGW